MVLARPKLDVVALNLNFKEDAMDPISLACLMLTVVALGFAWLTWKIMK